MQKTRRADSRNGWYLIEPSDAQRFLDEQERNRPLRESKALRFAEDIISGKWKSNGEPLIFDEDEKLLDGQGRCRACVIAGKSFESYIVYGIPRKLFPSVDTGQVRTGADTLALAGVSNYAVASAVCRWAIRSEAGSPASNIPTPNWKINDYARKNRERLQRALDQTQPFLNRAPLPPSILAYLYMEVMDANPEKAKEFLRGIAIGDGLPSGSPILTLRNRLMALAGDAHMLHSYEKLALAIKAWNFFLAGKSINQIRWTPKGSGRNSEPFPMIAMEAPEPDTVEVRR